MGPAAPCPAHASAGAGPGPSVPPLGSPAHRPGEGPASSRGEEGLLGHRGGPAARLAWGPVWLPPAGAHSRQVTIHVSASRSFQSTQSIPLTGLETRRELIKSREASAIEQRGPGRLVIRAPHNPLRPCHLLPAPRGPSPGDRQAATPSGPRSPLLDHLAPRLPPVTFLESAGRSHSPLAPSTCSLRPRGSQKSHSLGCHTKALAGPQPASQVDEVSGGGR